MKLIKITTPKGKAFIVPEGNNKAYYENLNREIKDPKLQYKIEPVEAKPPKKADNPEPAAKTETLPDEGGSKTGAEKENAGAGNKGKGRPSKQ